MKRNAIIKLLFLLLFTFISVSNSTAQKVWWEYRVSFPENAYWRDTYQPNSFKPAAFLKIVVEGSKSTNVAVNFAHNNGLNASGNNINFGVNNVSGITTIRLTDEQMWAAYCQLPATGTSTGSQISSHSLTVTTSVPVKVYAMIQFEKSTDATEVLEKDECGKEFYCINYPAELNRPQISYNYDAKAGYMVVAHENNTIVYENGVQKATLSREQVYSGYAFRSEMTGKHITTSQPAAFYSTTTMAPVPVSDQYDDVLFTNQAPVNQWGRHFIVPKMSDFSGHRIRVIASQNGTDITVKGADGGAQSVTGGHSSLSGLNAGEWVELKLTSQTGCYIVANKPVGVCTFLIGCRPAGASFSGNGDPAQAWLPPIEQMNRNIYATSYYLSPATTYPSLGSPTTFGLLTQLVTHKFVVIVPTATKDQTTQGVSTVTGTWYDVPNSGYSFITLPGSTSRTSFDNPGGVLVGMYGYGTEESYYYYSGYGTNDISTPYKIEGTVRGLPDNEGIPVYYTVDGGAQQSVLSTAGGAYTIPNIYYGSNVVITASPQPGYTGMVSPTPSTSNVKSNITKKDIVYTTISFTVNDEDYLHMDGKRYCNTNDFELKGVFPSTPPTSIGWELNGVEIPGSHNQTVVNVNDLPDGYYTVSMTVTLASGETTLTTHFYVGIVSVVWTPDANTTGSDTDKQSWDDVRNWTPPVVPTACHNVYIPGNCTHYPILTQEEECNNIYFMQGGELGRPDLLTYNQVYVHLNLGLKKDVQEKELDAQALLNLVLTSDDTYDRLKFSASTSQPLARERWYALSSPLRNVVSGDLGFGGFPLTFMMKFGPITKAGVNYPVGKWTTPYTDMKEKFPPSLGFGFYVYGFGNKTGNNAGCFEQGSFNDLNDLIYMPDRSGRTYGLQKTNGILELPFFADSLNMDGHRTQVYNAISGKSTFYYISDGTAGPFNTLTGKTDPVMRENNNGNYRFIAEEPGSGGWVFQNPILYDVTGLNIGDEFLAGNPYMSSIDPVEFCKINETSVKPEFHIWNGIGFETFQVDLLNNTIDPTVSGTSPYIAPLQGFFLTYMGGNVIFDVEKISTVRPIGSASNLRSASVTKENNRLRIKAENDFAASYALVKSEANNEFIRGKDVQKLFSPYDYVPEVYLLSGEIPVDICCIDNSVETIIPLGLKTEQLGNTSFTFTGMADCNQMSGIVLMDMLLNKEIDLSGLDSYTYSFENKVQGIQNDRFFIRILSAKTSLSSVEKEDDIRIYPNLSGILVSAPAPIFGIEVYDLQGRKLYEKTLPGTYIHQITGEFAPGYVIVRVKTKNRVENKKVAFNIKFNK